MSVRPSTRRPPLRGRVHRAALEALEPRHLLSAAALPLYASEPVGLTATNNPPAVVSPLADVTVAEDAPDTLIDLTPVFSDPDAGDVLTYVVSPTTVAGLVSEVSQSDYTHLHQDLLYTHLGDNRGDGAQHDLARGNIAAYFQSLGLTTTLEPFTYSSTTYYNVVGTKTGATRPNDIYIVGAHFDSVNNPGADDNASGTAAVMEIARVLSSYQFDATLRFIAFDREEQGLIGSTAYAAAAKTRGDNILGMVELDMIAYNPATNHDAVRLYDAVVGGSIKSALATAITTYGRGLSYEDSGQNGQSDHRPFEQQGYDAALMIEYNVWSNPYYHRATDAVETAGLIDYTYATQVTCAVTGYLATAAGLENTTSLLAAQISGNTLTLDYAAGQQGAQDVTVRAIDRQGAWVEDTFHVTVAPSVTYNLDADGNGTADALSDGILIIRYLFDQTGEWNYSDALGSGAARTTRQDIKDFLDGGRTTVLDVDGNGAPDALSDGILILRYLFDPPGLWNYSDALGSGATRTTRETIKAHLDQYNPATVPPGAAPAAEQSSGGVKPAPLAADEFLAAVAPAVLTAGESHVLDGQDLRVADTKSSPSSAMVSAEVRATDMVVRQLNLLPCNIRAVAPWYRASIRSSAFEDTDEPTDDNLRPATELATELQPSS